ncbi:MAG: PHP-associated domain-containing protein, partial [Candidatus Kryptoniota bacterium]
ANKKAMTRAKSDMKLMTAGSDAHYASEIGNAYVKCDASDIEEFRKKLVNREVQIDGKKVGIDVRINAILRRIGLIRPPANI